MNGQLNWIQIWIWTWKEVNLNNGLSISNQFLKSFNLMWQVVGYVGLGLKRPFWKLHVKFAKAKLGSLHADLTPPNIDKLIFFKILYKTPQTVLP